jgi:hypothetical protein
MKRTALASALLLLTVSLASAQPLKDTSLQCPGTPSEYDPSFSRATEIHGIPIPPGELATRLPDLKQKAHAGNAQAATTIAGGLLMCQGAMQRHDNSFYPEHCMGLTAQDLAERGKWLSLAAGLGNVEAQYGYAESGPSDLVGLQENGKAPVTIGVYKDTARRYLLALAQKCNVDGIGAIAHDGQHAKLFANDPAVSYKFLLVYETIARQPTYGSTDLENQLESKISSVADVSRAHQDAVTFVNNYCK